MGKPKGKLTPGLYDEIREYSKTHTIEETATKYGVSASTISWVRRYDSFREMRRGQQEHNQRFAQNHQQYQKPTTVRETIENPFPGKPEPKPIVPIGAQRAPEPDSEPVTRPMERSNGKTIYEWEAYAKKLEAEKTKFEAEKAELEKSKSELEEKLKLEIRQRANYYHPPVTVHQEETAESVKPLYDNEHIYVEVGETKLVIPIRK